MDLEASETGQLQPQTTGPSFGCDLVRTLHAATSTVGTLALGENADAASDVEVSAIAATVCTGDTPADALVAATAVAGRVPGLEIHSLAWARRPRAGFSPQEADPRGAVAHAGVGRAFGGAGSGVRDSDHVNRRPLPLLLAVLLATAGCVSVAPVDNKPPQDRTEVSAPAPAREAGEALPASRPPAPAVVVTPENSPSAPRIRREQHRAVKADASGSGVRTVREPGRLPVKAKRSSPKGRAPQPKPKAKPRSMGTSKAAVPQRSRPGAAPGASRVSMAELCRSSHGVTSPAITQLCLGTYR
ncbi:hypothetical protein ACFXAO_03885 [Streptomyces lavendulae]|uniref:hypothetical protein n=1 Tax=Streptomyces lavendulae TaxID=1914 RepID=UPI00368DF12B